MLLSPENGGMSIRLMVRGVEEAVATGIASNFPVKYQLNSSEKCEIDYAGWSKGVILCQNESGRLSIVLDW